MGLAKEKTMNTYLYNILWSINSGYLYYGVILGVLLWSFWTVIVIKSIDERRYPPDIFEDIIIPIFLGLVVAVLVVFLWPFLLAIILLLGINLLIVEIIVRIIIPFYRFIKSIPLLDFRKGEDND